MLMANVALRRVLRTNVRAFSQSVMLVPQFKEEEVDMATFNNFAVSEQSYNDAVAGYEAYN